MRKIWKPVKKLTQITTDDGRWYENSKRERFYSVTTVIDAQKSPQDIIALERYVQKEIDAGRDPKQPSIDGNLMHGLIENYLQEDYVLPEPTKDRGYKLFNQYYDNFLRPVHIVPHLIEGKLYASVCGYKYAGTVDLVATIQTEPEGPERLAVIDHKSIKNIKQVGWKEKKNLLQIAAYAKAIKDRYHKEVDVAIVNYASTTGFVSKEYSAEEIKKAWNNFYKYYLKKFYEEGHVDKLQRVAEEA